MTLMMQIKVKKKKIEKIKQIKKSRQGVLLCLSKLLVRNNIIHGHSETELFVSGTGLSCCISHLVVHHSHQWKFHLVGINSSPPLYCGPSQGPCLYTRESKPGQENDTNVYCFSSSKCVNKITHLHRVTPKLVKVDPHHLLSQAENEKLSNLSPVKRLLKVDKIQADQGACCPIKELIEGPLIKGIFVLKYKIPKKESHCNDNCVYTNVS